MQKVQKVRIMQPSYYFNRIGKGPKKQSKKQRFKTDHQLNRQLKRQFLM